MFMTTILGFQNDLAAYFLKCTHIQQAKIAQLHFVTYG